MMSQLKSFFFVALAAITLTGLVACQQAGQTTSDMNDRAEQAAQEARDTDINKPVVGNAQTGEYADKFATVEKKSSDPVDPYTGSQDKANYAGKEPIADEQTAADRAAKNQ